VSEHKGSSAGTGRGGAQRDLIVISSAALALLLIGVAFDLFDRTHRWLAARLPFPVDNLLAVLVILSGAFCAFGIRQWVQADRERGLRARSDERYQAAENRYRTIVERVPAVSYTWDAADEPGTSSALYISPQIERLLGYTPDEWRADPSLWDRCAHPEDREHALRAWAEATTAGQAFALEYRMNTRDGRSIWVRDEAVPIAPGRRGLPVYQGVMIDITEQKRAEEQYRTLIEHLPATV
jgi:PAS domain S-box-containing protein